MTATMQVNSDAVQKAKDLIQKHEYVKDSSWSEAQPSTERTNNFLKRHDWSDYSNWFLGIDPEAGEETKSRYHFPYGDFRRVHRDGLIAAKQRARQYNHDEVAKAADELLQLLDEVKAD
jgi:hypothetical protein